MNTERIKNYFAVPFDSELGKKLTDYHNRAQQYEKQAADWCRSLHEHYRFPELDDKTVIYTPEDSEAGGVMAIGVPESTLTPNTTPDPTIWNYITLPDEPGVRYYMPRVVPEMHYLRYKRAEQLMKAHDPEWDFVPYEKDPSVPHMYLYDQVRRIIPSRDLEQITTELGKQPSLRTRLALGTRYVPSTIGDQSVTSLTPDQTARAVRLYKNMTGLPIISANTLMIFVGFKLPGIKDMTREEMKRRVYIDTHIDGENERYLFRTGLVTDNPDVVVVENIDHYFIDNH